MTIDTERTIKEEKSDTRKSVVWTVAIVLAVVAISLLIFNSFEARLQTENTAKVAANTAKVAKSTAKVAKSTSKTVSAIRSTQKDTHTSVSDIQAQTLIITNAITALNRAYANIQQGADAIVANQAAICNALALDHVIPKCVLPSPTV